LQDFDGIDIFVIPVQTGIQISLIKIDSHFLGNDRIFAATILFNRI